MLTFSWLDGPPCRSRMHHAWPEASRSLHVRMLAGDAGPANGASACPCSCGQCARAALQPANGFPAARCLPALVTGAHLSLGNAWRWHLPNQPLPTFCLCCCTGSAETGWLRPAAVAPTAVAQRSQLDSVLMDEQADDSQGLLDAAGVGSAPQPTADYGHPPSQPEVTRGPAPAQVGAAKPQPTWCCPQAVTISLAWCMPAPAGCCLCIA